MESIAWDKIILGVLTLVGVIIGGSLTIVGNLLVKRQERKAQLHKLISEKRLDAHEELITTVRMATFGAGRFVDGEMVKYPTILQDVEKYDLWFLEYVVRCRRVSHLIEESLAEKLSVFQNYLHYFEQIALEPLRNSQHQISDQDAVEKIGQIVYPDFLSIGNSILTQASTFYSTDIYKGDFIPSTLSRDTGLVDENYSKYELFKREKEIEEIISKANK